MAPHAPYTLEPADADRRRATLANRHGVPLLIHLAETQDEMKIVQDAHHAVADAVPRSLGVWNGRSLAAHAVWLDDADMDDAREGAASASRTIPRAT